MSTDLTTNRANNAHDNCLHRAASPIRLILRAAALGLAVATIAPLVSRGDMLASHYNPAGILRYDEGTGAYLGPFVDPVSSGLVEPVDMAFGSDGNLYVADGTANRIIRYNGQTGDFLGVFASLNSPYAMTFGSDGNLYVGSQASPAGIVIVDGQTGTVLRCLTNSQLVTPNGLKFGPDGLLYVADRYAGVLRFDVTNGSLKNVFVALSNFPSYWPADLCFGPDGNLYVSEAGTYHVFRFNGTNGTNMGVFNASGNGLINADGVAFGADGDLYVVCNNYPGGGYGGGYQGVFRFNGANGAFVYRTTNGVVSTQWGLQRVVFMPPLANIRCSQVEVSWNSVSNATYRVDYRSSLTTNTWTPLVNCVQAVGTTSSVLDSIAVGEPQRFYRVAVTNCVPSP